MSRLIDRAFRLLDWFREAIDVGGKWARETDDDQ